MLGVGLGMGMGWVGFCELGSDGMHMMGIFGVGWGLLWEWIWELKL